MAKEYICPNCSRKAIFSDPPTMDEMWNYDACNVMSSAFLDNQTIPRCACGKPFDTGIFYRMKLVQKEKVDIKWENIEKLSGLTFDNQD